MNFRKKPVVIQAVQIEKGMDILSPDWLAEAIQNNTVVLHGFGKMTRDQPWVEIKTLEGTHRGDAGDWIIRGVKGELYPCKPDIFAATYETADESPRSPYHDYERDVREAVLNLFGASGADNFIIPIPGTTPPLYIAAGEAERICEGAAEQSAFGLTPAALKPRLIQDALRYRWLKSHASKIEWRESDVNGPLKLRPTLDADVDDAIAQLRPTKGGKHAG
jgi:hypothetical protein